MALYYFIDAAGERKLIGSGNIRWTGVWSGSTSYQIRDAASDGAGHFWMALVANTNIAIPSTFDSSVPTTWTHLVQAETSSLSPEDQAIATAAEAMALSTAALSTSWSGTTVAASAGTTASVAYSLALQALETAWAGTATANDALAQIGQAGTTATAIAIALANQALIAAWAGTAANLATNAVATAALTTAWDGTAAAAGAQGQADAALSVARTALTTAWAGTDASIAQTEAALAVATAGLQTSWVGTGAGHEAFNLGLAALETAWVGTAAALSGGAAYSIATAALDTSWVGTGAGHEALAVATAALEAAWVGTLTGQDAYNLGLTALDTSWVGTSTGHEAYDLARSAYSLAASGTGGLTGPAVSEANAIAAWFDASSGSLVSSPALVNNYGDITILNPLNPSQEKLWSGWSGNTYKIQSQITRPAADRDIEIHTSGTGALNFKTSGFTRIAMSDGGIRPGATNLYDLGSNALQWRQLHVSASAYFYGGAIYLGSSFDTPLIRDDIGKLSLRSGGAGGPKFEFRVNDGYTNSGTYSRLTIGTSTALFNGTTHVIMSEMAGQAVGATTYQLLPITLSATPGLRNQVRLNTDGSNEISGDVRMSAGTLGVAATFNDVNRTYSAVNLAITNTASSNTSSAMLVMTGNQEVFRLNKAGGLVISGSYGVIGSSSLGIGMESAGAYFQGFGGQPLFFQPIGNNVGMNMATLPTSRFEIGQSWGRSGTLVTNPIILGVAQNVVIANATSGPITVSLPTTGGATPATNRIYTVKKMDSSINAVTIIPSGDERINDQKSYDLLSQGQLLEVICVSGTWFSLGTI